MNPVTILLIVVVAFFAGMEGILEIGRASCRERV